MVVGRDRSGTGRRRTLRELVSVGGIVGCVALGVAVIVAPATSNLSSIVPDVTPMAGIPDVPATLGDVAVEVRPGAAAQRRAAVPALSPAQFAAAPSALGVGTPSVSDTPSFVFATSSTRAAGPALAELVVEVPAPLPTIEVVTPAPEPVAPVLTVAAAPATRPGKAKGTVKTTSGSTSSGSVYSSSSTGSPTSVTRPGKAAESPGQQRKAEIAPPPDQPPGRAPAHAAVHQRH